jgi:hypothetical protein
LQSQFSVLRIKNGRKCAVAIVVTGCSGSLEVWRFEYLKVRGFEIFEGLAKEILSESVRTISNNFEQCSSFMNAQFSIEKRLAAKNEQ